MTDTFDFSVHGNDHGDLDAKALAEIQGLVSEQTWDTVAFAYQLDIEPELWQPGKGVVLWKARVTGRID